jgi:hypothetical protein
MKNDKLASLIFRISRTIAGGFFATVSCKGPYEKSRKAYLALLDWIKKNSYQITGDPITGINYQTMTVTQAKKFIAAGMKDAKNGDRITMSVSKEKSSSS